MDTGSRFTTRANDGGAPSDEATSERATAVGEVTVKWIRIEIVLAIFANWRQILLSLQEGASSNILQAPLDQLAIVSSSQILTC